jgi:prophage regulatory protein
MKILRVQAVAERVGFAPPTVWRRAKNGSFPKPVRIGPKVTGWIESEVNDWLAARVAESRAADHAEARAA